MSYARAHVKLCAMGQGEDHEHLSKFIVVVPKFTDQSG